MFVYYVGVHRNRAEDLVERRIPFSTLTSYEWFNSRELDGGG